VLHFENTFVCVCVCVCVLDSYMEVVKECTKTSNVECRCQKGYVCTTIDNYTGQCRECVPITTPTLSYTSSDVLSSTSSSTASSTTSSTTSSSSAQSLLGKHSCCLLHKCFLNWGLWGNCTGFVRWWKSKKNVLYWM